MKTDINTSKNFIFKRFHRYRRNQKVRDAFAEITLSKDDLILPIFVTSGSNVSFEIKQMPGIYQMSPDRVIDYLNELIDYGLMHIILFGIPDSKDEIGKESYNASGPVPTAIRAIKDQFGSDLLVYADVCLCGYTSHGHCGIVTQDGLLDNDASLVHHSKTAVVYANAGADWVAPSGMLDGRVYAIRTALDDHGHHNVGILSYSAKFASNYYGPFRQAVETSLLFGDRKTYQIDYRTKRQPLGEINEDIRQGADAIMVKPALTYLDIISKAKEMVDVPIYAYNVSGEYALVKFGAKKGNFDERNLVLENLTAIKRAGANQILTYHTQDILKMGWL